VTAGGEQNGVVEVPEAAVLGNNLGLAMKSASLLLLRSKGFQELLP